MTIAVSAGAHNISAAPVILAVIIIGIVTYLITQRRKNRSNGQDK
jgi:uncharacterized protein HemX